MSIFVYRAMYGEHDGSHHLLDAPPDAEDAFKRLLRHTDRPRVLDDSTFSGPALNGFPFGAFYALIKIFPDPKATRPGMVRTWALLVPIDDAARTSDVPALLSLLPSRLPPSVPCRSNLIKLGEEDLPDEVSGDRTTSAFYGGLVRSVLSAAERNEPVVWSDAQSLAEAASVLWQGLWPAARERFSFRHGVGPQDLGSSDQQSESELRLIACPASRRGTWGRRPTVGPDDDCDDLSLAESYVLRHPAGEPLRQFEHALGAHLGTVSDLKFLEDCHRHFEDVAYLDAGQVVALAKQVVYLSPDPAEGEDIKAQIVRRMEAVLPGGEAEDIGRLRNFDPKPFEGGEEVVAGIVREWSTSVPFARPIPEAHARLISECFASGPTKLWRDAFRSGLAETLGHWPKCARNALWEWWMAKPSLVSQTDELLPHTPEVENDLAGAVPSSLPDAVAEEVTELSRRRAWSLLYAAVLASSLPPRAAFERFMQATDLQREAGARFAEGLHLIADRAGGKNTVAAALALQNELLYALAGEACVDAPRLLARMDVARPAWRAVWLERVRTSRFQAERESAESIERSLWEGVSDPSDTMNALLAAVAEGKHVSEELLLFLSESRHADLRGMPNRSALWLQLPSGPKERFMTRTAEGWIQRFLADPETKSLEEALRPVVLGEIRRLLGLGRPSTVREGVRLFKRFDELSQQRFLTWLRSVLPASPALSQAEASALGRLVHRRDWNRAASKIYRLASDRMDLRPALQECRGLLSFLDSFFGTLQGLLGSPRLGPDDWWRTFAEIGANLYPEGVGDRAVWSRAGGDLSAVNMNQAGRTQWTEALHQLRYGGAGEDVSADRLLGEMRADFPRNSELRLLAENRHDILN